MIGTVRMRNIRILAEQILEDGIAGDFLEAGVWRGGACIYMRGILDAHSDAGRTVFVADSFAGLPQPDQDRYPADAGDPHHTWKKLAVSLEDVKNNFAPLWLARRAGHLSERLVHGHAAQLSTVERPSLSTEDKCLFVYTSGTTGLPKAANLNQIRGQPSPSHGKFPPPRISGCLAVVPSRLETLRSPQGGLAARPACARMARRLICRRFSSRE